MNGDSFVADALSQIKYMDILQTSFKFKVLDGDERKIATLLEKKTAQYNNLLSSSLDAQTKTRPVYDGNDLIVLAATHDQTSINEIMILVLSYLLVGLKLIATLVPLYHISNFYKIVENHSQDFIGLYMWTFSMNYALKTSVIYILLIGEGDIKKYFNQLRWMSRLINVDLEKEKEFEKEEPSFKLNIFCENSLETWLTVTLLLRKTWNTRIFLSEISILGMLIYILLFMGMGATAYILNIEEEVYFAYGYLWVLLYVDMFFFFLPVLFYLYYGYKVNSYSASMEIIFQSLIAVYEKISGGKEEIAWDGENSKRYCYFLDCLKTEISKTKQPQNEKDLKSNEEDMKSNEEELNKNAKRKLESLKAKAESILSRYQKNEKRTTYKFCGLLECTLGVYQSIAVGIFGVLWSSIVKYINKLQS